MQNWWGESGMRSQSGCESRRRGSWRCLHAFDTWSLSERPLTSSPRAAAAPQAYSRREGYRWNTKEDSGRSD